MHSSYRCTATVFFIIFLGKCLGAQGFGGYSDDIARHKFFPLAAAAYSASPQHCIKNKYRNASTELVQNVYRGIIFNKQHMSSFQLGTYYSGQCDPDPNDSCAGFTAVLHDDKAIVLSFRGTMRTMQLVEEADLSAFHEKTKWVAGGHVSTYFYNAFMAVWNGGLKESFKALHAKYPKYHVWVSVHSTIT
ncbi:hypothetical protein ANCCAN_27848 [Ancylostoma caninum]|uniref:Fungal lipase-type domain-containing protein n=1 Tax=Ancylostoma caninum TaxID=29170 RepID=A0A368F6A8_ANCCA|nr:hypothetical protein ANCCAN_27848 [Ancylostoma caninum]